MSMCSMFASWRARTCVSRNSIPGWSATVVRTACDGIRKLLSRDFSMAHPGIIGALMSANPYASVLGDRSAVEVIEETSRRLSEIVTRVSSSNLEWRPAPGKWNAREIICHLADCEIAFAFRLRQTLAETNHVMQPFDQEKWAGMYGALSARAALSAFSSLREWDLALIHHAPPGSM